MFTPSDDSIDVLSGRERQAPTVQRYRDGTSLVYAVGDGVVILTTLALACVLTGVPFSKDLAGAGIIGVCAYYLLASLKGHYRSYRTETLRSEIWSTLELWLGVSGVSMIVVYVRQDHGYSPETMLLWFLQTSLSLAAWRAAFRQSLRWARARGYNTRRLAIAGTGELARHVASTIEENGWMGFYIVGLFGDVEESGARRGKSRARGSLEDLSELARRGEVDAIFIALSGATDASQIDLLIRKLSDSTASVYLMPDRRTRDGARQQDSLETLPDRWRIDVLHRRLVDMGGIKAISVYETPFLGAEGFVKRIEDIAVSSVALSLLAIPMLVIALGVKLSSPGPIIFKQRRYGLDGKPIVVWKFRTMSVCEDAGRVTQAKQDDPRVTSFGGFLRRTSLDELPQFMNVFRGSMSVVGPRPHAVSHNEYYRGLIGGYMLRHQVKPGITGWAQVHGWRGETDCLDKMGRRIDFDLDYIRNWSLWLDIRIILMTFVRGFVHANAY